MGGSARNMLKNILFGSIVINLFQIRQHIDDGAFLAIEVFDSIYTFYNNQIKEGTTLARSWVRGVDFGGIDLEQLLFAEEIEAEKNAPYFWLI